MFLLSKCLHRAVNFWILDVESLIETGLRSHQKQSPRVWSTKFPGGACPQTPLYSFGVLVHTTAHAQHFNTLTKLGLTTWKLLPPTLLIVLYHYRFIFRCWMAFCTLRILLQYACSLSQRMNQSNIGFLPVDGMTPVHYVHCNPVLPVTNLNCLFVFWDPFLRGSISLTRDWWLCSLFSIFSDSPSM